MRLLPPDRDLGWTPYVWLIYLAPYLAFPVLVRPAPAQWAIHAAGLLIFLPLYFAGFWLDGARRLPVILALTALGVSLTWFNPASAVFFVFATSFIGGARTGRDAAAWVIGITLVAVAAAWPAGPLGPYTAAFAAVFGPLIGFINLQAAEMRRRDASLRMAHDEIARLAMLAERDRIAGELHDLLGHSLSVIALKSDLAARLIDRDPARAAREMADAARVSREALAEVRAAVQGFRATGLADEIARAQAVLRTAGIEPRLDLRAGVDAIASDLPEGHEHALSLALREAVTNVVRHSRAAHCRITLGRDAGAVRLVIEDDGVGGALVEGNGLTGMRRRVEGMGGTVRYDGAAGARLAMTLPIVTASEAHA